ncbi:type II toxin-antitoxin system VapC family toxin [Gordonibacter sp.]|uniref:type II toxin-antitoxin system VapC family toxin n=1 Tax=Gordonibacter sp. TaxID=1968902 RepID=UPI002FC837B4
MIVLDCDAAVNIALETTQGNALRALMVEGEKAVAPSLLHAELTHAFKKYVQAGVLSAQEAVLRMRKAQLLVDEYCDDAANCAEVIAESIRLNHSTYDVFYFVLARREAATLFTLDRKLQKLCLDNGVNCVLVDTEF